MIELTNARVVTPREVVAGSVTVDEGVIVSITPDATTPDPARFPGALDLQGDYLVPGVVELHTDVLERHA
ncbi:MAG TPA: hypothetical protein VN323_18610, partial [Candidatus Dormibacteraeota bacterium]|nr:hypothetical protein [Candidatus Dormibacteraeota bacterium]